MGSKKKRSSSDSPLYRWNEEILRHLSSMLKSFSATQKIRLNNVQQLVEIVFIDQTRAPWPGSFLSPEKKENWKKFVQKTSQILVYENSEAAYLEFACKITSRLLRELSATQITSTLLSQESIRHAQVEHMVRQEFNARASASETVSRSVQRYLKADAKTRRDRTELKMAEDNPLRDLLGLPRIGRNLLPHEDVRVHLARFLKSPSIERHLQRASSFLSSDINNLFSDELAKLCRPIGFADRHYKILLVEAASASAAQELTFNKASIVSQIRKLPGFDKVEDIKFRIASISKTKGASFQDPA